MSHTDSSESTPTPLRIDAQRIDPHSQTRKGFWLNAYLALLQAHSPQEAEGLADQALDIALKRWEDAEKYRFASFVVIADQTI
jgi:hypothetical protein